MTTEVIDAAPLLEEPLRSGAVFVPEDALEDPHALDAFQGRIFPYEYRNLGTDQAVRRPIDYRQIDEVLSDRGLPIVEMPGELPAGIKITDTAVAMESAEGRPTDNSDDRAQLDLSRGILVVADGVGQESAVAAQTISAGFIRSMVIDGKGRTDKPKSILRDLGRAESNANNALRAAQSIEGEKNSGANLIGAQLIEDGKLAYRQTGNTGLFLINPDGSCKQLTKDNPRGAHSGVAELQHGSSILIATSDGFTGDGDKKMGAEDIAHAIEAYSERNPHDYLPSAQEIADILMNERHNTDASCTIAALTVKVEVDKDNEDIIPFNEDGEDEASEANTAGETAGDTTNTKGNEDVEPEPASNEDGEDEAHTAGEEGYESEDAEDRPHGAPRHRRPNLRHAARGKMAKAHLRAADLANSFAKYNRERDGLPAKVAATAGAVAVGLVMAGRIYSAYKGIATHSADGPVWVNPGDHQPSGNSNIPNHTETMGSSLPPAVTDTHNAAPNLHGQAQHVANFEQYNTPRTAHGIDPTTGRASNVTDWSNQALQHYAKQAGLSPTELTQFKHDNPGIIHRLNEQFYADNRAVKNDTHHWMNADSTYKTGHQNQTAHDAIADWKQKHAPATPTTPAVENQASSARSTTADIDNSGPAHTPESPTPPPTAEQVTNPEVEGRSKTLGQVAVATTIAVAGAVLGTAAYIAHHNNRNNSVTTAEGHAQTGGGSDKEEKPKRYRGRRRGSRREAREELDHAVGSHRKRRRVHRPTIR